MPHETSVQPKLADLLATYLEKQAGAYAHGMAAYDPEVTPYEVGPVQPLDPKLAWEEAQLALGVAPAQRRLAPPHWPTLVAQHESVVAIAFCAGNFPQLVRNFRTILTEPNLPKLRPEPGHPAPVELTEWTENARREARWPQLLLALGTLRLAKHFEAADAFVQAQDAFVPTVWRTAWDNEKAALAWHRGHFDAARRLWDALEATTPVLFNRGMAALFANDLAGAKQFLSAASAQLPENSAWHHLAHLYLTMAQLRG